MALSSSTTSAKPPEDVILQVRPLRTPRRGSPTGTSLTSLVRPPFATIFLHDRDGQVVQAAKQLDLAIEQLGPFVVRIGGPSSVIEVEVCRLLRFSKVHGIRFRRMTGTSEAYKSLCERLLSILRL